MKQMGQKAAGIKMRDLSGYTPSELDVASIIKNEIQEEINAFGKAFHIRVYPTSYMLKLAEQLGSEYDENYKEVDFNGRAYIIGSNSTDEEAYFVKDDLIIDRLTKLTKKERDEAVKKGTYESVHKA